MDFNYLLNETFFRRHSNEYLIFLSMINDTLVCKLNIVKFIESVALTKSNYLLRLSH